MELIATIHCLNRLMNVDDVQGHNQYYCVYSVEVNPHFTHHLISRTEQIRIWKTDFQSPQKYTAISMFILEQ